MNLSAQEVLERLQKFLENKLIQIEVNRHYKTNYDSWYTQVEPLPTTDVGLRFRNKDDMEVTLNFILYEKETRHNTRMYREAIRIGKGR